MTWVGNCVQRNPRQMMVINGFAVDARFDWIIADRFPSRWSMGIFSSSSSTTFIEYNQKSSNSHLLTERNNCWSSSPSSECNLTDAQRKFIEIVGENCAKRILISTVNDATIRHVCENIVQHNFRQERWFTTRARHICESFRQSRKQQFKPLHHAR